MNAFISYSHTDRQYGAQVKKVLAELGFESFLAYEDLEVSEEWQARILSELRRCDVFVALLSQHFLASRWAPQEAGFIISRSEVLVTPLSIDGTTPFGFLSHLQSRRIPDAGLTRELLIEPLAAKMPRTVLPALVRIAGAAKSFRDAEAQMAPLVRFFPNFTAQEAEALAKTAITNAQIWSAALCRTDYLPKFIHAQGANLDPIILRALQYEVEHDEPYL